MDGWHVDGLPIQKEFSNVDMGIGRENVLYCTDGEKYDGDRP